MTPTLIVLVLLIIGVGIVVWATRRKPGSTSTGPREGDTAWNDPVTPGEPARPQPPRPDAPVAVTPPPEDPRP
jgi:hypothetical protein